MEEDASDGLFFEVAALCASDIGKPAFEIYTAAKLEVFQWSSSFHGENATAYGKLNEDTKNLNMERRIPQDDTISSKLLKNLLQNMNKQVELDELDKAQEMLQKLSVVSKQMGLEVNILKTHVMTYLLIRCGIYSYINGKQIEETTLKDDALEEEGFQSVHTTSSISERPKYQIPKY
ncbi:hypothetical protein Trydic_g12785 [Trypoxylus dichotomus]